MEASQDYVLRYGDLFASAGESDCKTDVRRCAKPEGKKRGGP